MSGTSTVPIEQSILKPLAAARRFWLLLAAAALYLPVESCLEVWSGPFLRDLGDRRYLRSRIFGFWCAYLPARFATFCWSKPRS